MLAAWLANAAGGMALAWRNEAYQYQLIINVSSFSSGGVIMALYVAYNENNGSVMA